LEVALNQGICSGFLNLFAVAASQREEVIVIEIMCEGGCVLAGVCMPYPVMCHLLQDSVIPEDGFVELDFMDGTRGLIRKKSIIGFYETEKSAQA
jgi:hypothetical protein